jgi:hypothetical protein
LVKAPLFERRFIIGIAIVTALIVADIVYGFARVLVSGDAARIFNGESAPSATQTARTGRPPPSP